MDLLEQVRPVVEQLPEMRDGYSEDYTELSKIRKQVLVERHLVSREHAARSSGCAVVVDRNKLEWRLDPTSPHRLPDVTGPDQTIVVVCDEGYASSLAADTLRRLGLVNATDLDGGYQAWRRWSAG